MTQNQRLYHIVNRMLARGIVLGAVGGFLVAWMVVLFWSYPNTRSALHILDHILGSAMLALLVGGVSGLIYGFVSSLIAGCLMALLTAVAFRDIRRPMVYKLAMGSITAIVTITIFYLGGLWSFIDTLTDDFIYNSVENDLKTTMAGVMILAVVIAVYVSQTVSKKYINDLAIRKKKGVA